jgi:hypothetical protein
MAGDTMAQRSRRAVLTAALGAAGAMVAGAMVGAQRVLAAGDDGTAVRIGNAYNDVRSETILRNTATNAPVLRIRSDGNPQWAMSVTSASGGEAIHAYCPGNGIAVHANSFGDNGVYGVSLKREGVYGLSSSDTYSGIHGQNANNGAGVSGDSPHGVGTQGVSQSNHGVFGQSDTGNGVYGFSASGTGVQGVSQSDQGVYGQSDTANGVWGYCNGAGNGVFGFSADGVGVRGNSSTGRGAVFKSDVAMVRLMPSTAATHPTNGASGDLFVDVSDRLWFCKGGANWTQLA